VSSWNCCRSAAPMRRFLFVIADQKPYPDYATVG
jgi:hypothetical protein